MKTLYVSDLDGTLLRSDQTLSSYTVETLNNLVEKGMVFSYATARSYVTSHKVTEGLNARIPLITSNGAFIVDNVTGENLISNYFGSEVNGVLDNLIAHDIYPMVFSNIDSVEKLSFVEEKCTDELKAFLDMRKGDKRLNPVKEVGQLYQENIFYILCADKKEKLEPFYHEYKEKYHCVFQKEMYTGAQWLEILPLETTKANAIRQLKDYLQCDKIVVFGDGKNDTDMFEMADECYAVENAVKELKEMATQIIGSNDEDGVVRWLEENYRD